MLHRQDDHHRGPSWRFSSPELRAPCPKAPYSAPYLCDRNNIQRGFGNAVSKVVNFVPHVGGIGVEDGEKIWVGLIIVSGVRILTGLVGLCGGRRIWKVMKAFKTYRRFVSGINKGIGKRSNSFPGTLGGSRQYLEGFSTSGTMLTWNRVHSLLWRLLHNRPWVQIIPTSRIAWRAMKGSS